tara:strand:+ start:206 stop:922 length:717 start_codon:yes stop_codon:yes gene_type:complete
MKDRDFKGIWIPKEIWLGKDLTLQEKIFFIEIDSLDNEDGCFAGNAYFSEFFNISKTRVSLVIKSLIDKKYITSTIIYKEGTKQILKRVLKVCYIPYITKVKDPIQQKLKDNNTLNNTSNNTSNKSLPKKTEIVFLVEKEIYPKFEDFWNLYDKKISKDKVKTKWSKIKQSDKDAIMQNIPLYKNSVTDKQFLKHPLTYLNNKSWEDEIIITNNNQKAENNEQLKNITTSIRSSNPEL